MPRLVLDAVHFDQLHEHGGLPGLRDENALEAALARPRQKWHYDKEIDLADLAAAYAFGLSKSHPYNDGNKRMAFLTMMIFLGLNKKDLEASEADAVKVMIALASGSLTEPQMAEWIRGRLIRLMP